MISLYMASSRSSNLKGIMTSSDGASAGSLEAYPDFKEQVVVYLHCLKDK